MKVGHDGFHGRSEKVNFYKMSFSENVAMNAGQFDPVACAVQGWINSPGHRKNMLGSNNVCGVSVYCNFGEYYFTQLFALTS